MKKDHHHGDLSLMKAGDGNRTHATSLEGWQIGESGTLFPQFLIRIALCTNE
jgi:hypothetical protein